MADYDLTIIGGGPGGYVAAIRASQLGLKTSLIEKDRLGGLCLNWGCIPTKALLYNAEVLHLLHRAEEYGITTSNVRPDLSRAIERSREVAEKMVKGVEFLMTKNKIDVIQGTASFKSATEVVVQPEGRVIAADNVIVATGGVTRLLPGIEIDGSTMITSREALELRELPESIVIVGGGPIGVEFGYFYRTYGSEVTIVEMLDHLLPAEDADVSAFLERSFKQQGIGFMTKTRVEGIDRVDGKARVKVSSEGGERELTADKVLMAIGIGGSTTGLGLEGAGIRVERGFIDVDGAMRTNVPNVYAIGDVTGKLALAHVASEQGVIAVKRIAGLNPPALDYTSMPRCAYCQPQVASVGLTEADAKANGRSVQTGRFPFRANGKATAAAAGDGFVKIVIDADYGQVLGCHIIGPEATELIAEATLAVSSESTVSDLIWTVHAHPTLSEAVKEAALLAKGQGIHFYSESRGERA